MAEIEEPEGEPIQVPAPWRWPEPRREETPQPRVPERVPA
jgi:hypothetical protein